MNYNLRPELLLRMENAASILTEEQKIALKFQYALTDLAALARIAPSMPESWRLGISQFAMSLGFNLYTLYVNRLNENKYHLNINDPMHHMEMANEHKLKFDEPRPEHRFRPRPTPNGYPSYH